MLIGEVSKLSGVSARMLRHYEKLGLVEPKQSTAGYREYSEGDVRRIFHIEGLRSLGLSLKQVGDALEDPDFDPQAVISEMIAETSARISMERELLARLKAVRHAQASDWESALDAVQILRRLRSGDPAQRQAVAFDSVSGKEAVALETLVESALGESHLNAEGALSWAVVQRGEEAVALAARGLRSKDAAVRLRAVRIVASARTSLDGTEQLRPMIRDPDALVRAETALALGKSGDESAVEQLVSMVLTGLRDVEAAELLAGFGEPVQLDVFKKFARALDDEETMSPARGRIAQALAEFNLAPVAFLVKQLVDDDNPTVAFTAAAIIKAKGLK
ncbi:MerR family transcriptional regulator [[Brevibacterium] flavum]|uniref:MerR family transcriptional regulator n=1 Tax=[Brevibacterium] flavum TaxID=92706 RepID=A0A0F6Z6C1_9CORY|nr:MULTISPECIES: MerR family transcriptional regulator [Corynebacterium]AKF27933.1 MerR family transcriptional regulator [[Brevibacterium] flavum]ANE08765.1 MerR family transcriptional regulator [Corynebacterium glutamicum]AST21177.1 MerR family transcriptional regulator [Corynebacterium glutamicum ATCC 14067]KEI23689.1 MerR family transcriptional regulator [Corynebacterium glutamicum ATCC 14067]OKX96383.1 MerR family transcriptional regulator [Corynebacterium glutamicum]